MTEELEQSEMEDRTLKEPSGFGRKFRKQNSLHTLLMQIVCV